MTLTTSVTMGSFVWETGKQLIDVEVTLGSAEKSSSCRITVSDPFHTIAAAVINHSVSLGGIAALPGSVAPTVAMTNFNPVAGIPRDTKSVSTVGSMAASGAEFTPSIKAMLDTVAKRETNQAKVGDFTGSYYANNGVPGSTGNFNDADIQAGGGFPKSAGLKFNVGRYQVNRGDWEDAQKHYKRKLGFSPVDQDLIAYWKLMYRKVMKPLAAGDIAAALTKAGNEWASVPYTLKYQNQVQPGTTKKEYLDFYQQRLAFYQGKVAPAVPVKEQPTVAPSKAISAPATTKPPLPDTSSTGIPVIKGSVITVTISGISFEFYHQGTEMSESGTTVLTGQGVRWSMSRRKRNQTLKDIKLSQVASLVAKAHGLTLSYRATIDPEYSHLDQSGISDYKFLLREVEENGLMMTEDKTTLVIMERKQMQPLGFRLVRGLNLMSYNISDRALGSQSDEMSQYLPQESKTTIDPLSGVAKRTVKDVSSTKSSSKPTGAGKPPTKGIVKGGDQGLLEKSRTKRIAGLPSTFTVPLSAESLVGTPLQTCITEGFPNILNRIWVIEKLTHRLADNTTTYDLVSPVDVADTDPPKIAVREPAKNVAKAGGSWYYPVTGTVSSLQSPNRNGRPHKGVDIGASNGTSIYAAGDGTVVTNSFEAAGAGNYIQIKHPNGYFTAYFHMLAPSSQPVGSKVKAGDKVGEVGNTGRSSGAHLHFELLTSISPAVRLQVGLTFPKLLTLGASITAGTSV